jgi:hypothetical protein
MINNPSYSSRLTETEAKSLGVTPNNTKSKPAPQNSKVSNLLESLKGKKKMTTIQKSEFDWGKYKKEEKIESELEQQRKDGYLFILCIKFAQ